MNIYIITFCVTAVWDLVLQRLSENYDRLPEMIKYDFIRYLQPYFQKHTVLSAMLLAGFVGTCSQYMIVQLQSFPNVTDSWGVLVMFMVWSFIVSALGGFVMKCSGLFPHLDETYYQQLGTYRSMYHDGLSGIIVQLTIFLLLYGIQQI